MLRTSRRARVIVFAKAPVPGCVKTRLAPRLGEEGAAALHARLVKHTLATVKRAGFKDIELHGSPADDPFLRFCAERYDARLVAQSGGDLGTRMCHAFRSSDALNTLLLGTDCPALTPHHLTEAARALAAGADAVIVPVEDGGYALMGLARCDRRLFADIAWSTPAVLGQTRARLRELKLEWRELELLWDVDTPADYDRLLASRLLDRRASSAPPPASSASLARDDF